jgi:hypothetical protein
MSPELADKIEWARGWWDRATPDERKAMLTAQRESYVRAMTTPCPHGIMDFEDCGDCRYPTASVARLREGDGL